MLDIIGFAIIAVLGILASVLVFVFKDILHATLALASVFGINSLFFLLLNQPLLAVIQFFIMVGGIATFIFIGVASVAYSKFSYTRLVGMLILWIILFAAMAVPLINVNFVTVQYNTFGASDISSSLQLTIGMYYILIVTMFGISMGAVILLKRLGAAK